MGDRVTFTIGERVWWKHTGKGIRRGTIQDFDGTIGVVCDSGGVLYVDPEQLHPQEPGVFADIPEAAYHGDRGSLSHSGAKLLLPPSCPAKFRWVMDNPPEPKPHFDFGSLAHTLILGKGATIELFDFPDWRSKAASEGRKACREAGLLPVLKSEYERAEAMADAVRQHPVAGPLFDSGDAELSMYVDHPSGVRLRGRADWITNGKVLNLGDRVLIADYKTSADASPDELPRAIAKWKYSLQFAWYVRLAKALRLGDDPMFLFVFQEKQPPYLVNVVELDAEAFDHGSRQMDQAIATYTQCRESGVWPGYPEGINPISLPLWAVDMDEEMEFSA